MRPLHRLIAVVWLLGLLAPLSRGAATPAEEIAFNAAARSFQDGFYERAEKELGAFTSQFLTSEHLPEVVLLQAQARLELGRHDGAIELLKANLNRAGKAADKYRFWMGEAQFQKGDYAAAAVLQAQLLNEFPDSFLRSKASYSEAMAWFKLSNLTNVIDRLSATNRPFIKLAQAQPNDEFVVRSYLLLSQAQMLQGAYRPAEETLNLLVNRSLPPQLNWQRQYWLVRVQLADGRPEAALNNLTNLLSLATATGVRTSQAETVLLQGQVLQAVHQTEAAIQAYEKNLDSLPDPLRRQALMELVKLNLVLTNSAQAIQGLERILAQYPQEPDSNQARLALGELRLKEYYTQRHSAAKTNALETLAARLNLLQQAQTNFDQLIAAATNSPLLGQAYLNRGWCLWEAGRMAESAAAFKEATERLSLSTNQVVARFKWADALFQLKDYTNAHANYRFILDHASALPGLSNSLLERTLFQIVRTSAAQADLAGATDAGERILAQFPNGEYGDRSLLLLGQLLNRQGKPGEARVRFADLLKRFPQSALVPAVHLAIARTYVQEADWAAALGQYDEWVVRFTNHHSLPQVEFDRAWVYDLAGRETNAVQLYTDFVARFPRHPLAPVAQNAVGNYFFNQSQYVEAEKNYQLLYQNTNWPASELTYQARLSAGRSAYERQGFSDAAAYFTNLINILIKDTNSPQTLSAQAYFALGDTMIAMASPGDPTNSLNRFAEAINAFQKIPETDPFAPRAWGRIADCHLQLAALDPNRYALASNSYQRVISAPLADIAARSQAEVGLAEVLRKQANARPPPEQPPLLDVALDHYLNVALEKNLRPGEKPDPFWFAKAGQEAAQLLEAQAKWQQVVNLYQRLLDVLPSLRAGLEKKLDQAKKRL